MKKQLLALIAFTGLFGLQSHAQMSIYDNDFGVANPLNCDSLAVASTTNFVDMGGNYLPNTDETITFCPNLAMGSKVSITFATNIGFEFNIDPTDTLYIYDGPDITAPLIGAYNSATNINGFNVQASFINNPTGCLTVRFVSDGANEGTGWVANVACGDLAQPFYPHLEAFVGGVNGVGPNIMNPLDTGYVDVCFGDSILLVAKPLFPYSFENTGTGYSQNTNNCDYTWTIGGVGVFASEDDSLWFLPPARQGYFVDLRILDPFPQPARITCKVRVSQLPIFAGTGPIDDTVCLGLQTELIGGVTPTDTVGVAVPPGSFGIGGVFAGLTPLPDGTGVQYETTIGITGLNGGTVTSPNDITSICLDIEHSYIGDIEIALTCPNGTTVSLMNAFNQAGGLIPGGCGNGISTFLGNDTNLDGGAPGSPTWTYCFSEVNATTTSICANALAGTNIINNGYGFPSMDPSFVYAPDGSFSDFIGCPLDGPWTVTVQDNQGVDDGYIFQWTINFDASLYPEPETYQNEIVTDFWTNDPTIISGQSDTAIVVVPNTPGSHSYTYNVTDDFGCSYDTTVVIFTLPQPTIFPDTMACFQNFNVQGTTAFAGGVWSASDTCIHFNPSNTALNPSIWTTVPGTYTVTFTDNACGTAVSSEIFYPGTTYTQVLDTILCVGVSYVINAQINPNVLNYSWNTGETGPSITILSPGDYIVTATNECYTHSDTATIGNKVCDIAVPNIITLSSLSGNNIFFIEYEGVKTFECTILNRWGNLIYEYTDPAGGWDGRTKGGDLVDEGTYFYMIKAELESGEELTKQGFVQVYH